MENQGTKPKKAKLTRKRKGFVKDFVISGNATEAAMKNFDTDNPKTAASIGAELLQKPEIQEAVVEAEKTFKELIDAHMPEESVIKRHVSQLNATRLDHMTFPLGPEGEDDINLSGAIVSKPIEEYDEEDGELPREVQERTTLTDKEIIDMLAEVNCTVRRIVHGEQARHVYFWSPDNNARDKALDKAYKIRGRYVDEANPAKTPSNVTYNFLFAGDTQEKIAIINKEIKQHLIHAKPNQKAD